MDLPNPFKLEKLQITAFREAERKTLLGKFEVMYNPPSFSMQHQNVFQPIRGIHTSGQPQRFMHTRSRNLALELMLDGTGVGEMGLVSLLGGGPKPVAEQVEQFLDLCFYRDSEIHEPKYLRIHWGKYPLDKFDCRIESVDIQYTSFEKSGAPLAATLSTRFIEDVPRQGPLSSPDLTHRRTVLAGDTLPLLCRAIYGSSAHYLWVARQNDLDDFRRLIPGQELSFPPLPKDLRTRGKRAGGAAR